jgi:hypothetical protein
MNNQGQNQKPQTQPQTQPQQQQPEQQPAGIPVDLYDCAVRLGGNMLHTVPKTGINAWEVRLLAHIHGGNDAIADRKKVGIVTIADRQAEYFRLARTYGSKAVQKVFPDADFLDYESWLNQQVAAEEEQREDASRVRQQHAIRDQIAQEERALAERKQSVAA